MATVFAAVTLTACSSDASPSPSTGGPDTDTVDSTLPVNDTVPVEPTTGGSSATSPPVSEAPPTVTTAEALTATIELLSTDLSSNGIDRAVIVAPLLDGAGVGLETQAAVIAALDGVIAVQFIDDAPSALVDDGAAVVDDALLLRLAVSDPSGSSTVVMGEHWLSIDDVSPFTTEVTWTADGLSASFTDR
jgi:hypothetical protein